MDEPRHLVLAGVLLSALLVLPGCAPAVRTSSGASGPSGGPLPSGGPGPSGKPVAGAPVPPGLDRLIDRDGVIRIRRPLPDGSRLLALGLGTDGTVLGASEVVDPPGIGALHHGVWRAGPGEREARLLRDTGKPWSLWRMATGAGGHLWPWGERLRCLDRSGRQPVRSLPGWTGRTLFFSGRVLVWEAEGGRLMTARGCADVPRLLPVRGTLVAFSHPHAFVLREGPLLQVDVRTGGSTAVRGLPASAARVEPFDAGPGLLAFVHRDALRVVDRRTGRPYAPVGNLPRRGAADFGAGLSVGTRIVVYSARHIDRDVSESLVYDPRTGRTVALPGEALAAGDRLLWRDGDHYLLARVRP
ncbi:hypothetical protein GCM10010156_74400 [Planobispora rosea]|uniref:Uncharacterized protein n=1 Tax=Planobispora rosea TaxID=35762 RepID=A0A8J3WIA5_PLARO|nr:hypothetical protein [Planobispora rosea]GGT05953.1 hypothetical protein GCM10010156_74400 [Planobispora rosea]GIH88666.1 hypothetical protein Pro02_70740 [Planobispora rosea]